MLLGTPLAKAAEATAKYYDPFQIVRLGKTDLKFPRIALGTGVSGGMRQSNATRMGKEKYGAVLRAAYERGVRMFDLADLYGTHPFLIPALKDIPRKDIIISTKIWWRPGGIPEKERPDAHVVIERFLKEIQTDYLDLVLLHCVDSATWPKQLSKQMEILANLKKKGAIRAHGVSCHSLPALTVVATEPWVDSVHARVNHLGTLMDASPDKVAPVLQKIHEAGKGVIGMKIFGEGRFRNSDEQRDSSIKYVLGLGAVDILNVGFEKAEEIDDFATRVRKVPVTA
jgi:aryl-alcohol dehydrogenase-like predicted oxidoreductase